MAGKTWLELTNAVLSRLRENAVTTVSQTSYSSMIGAFVNETKREVEDAWDWTALRSTQVVTTIGGTSTYVLTGVGKRFRVLSAFNVTFKAEMAQISATQMNYIRLLTTPQTAEPIYYTFSGASGGDPILLLNPVPLGVSTLNFNLVLPQPEFTADATAITVPDWPVIMGAWAKAISERGEDGGANTSEVQAMYAGALADSIQADVGLAPDEIIWQVQ